MQVDKQPPYILAIESATDVASIAVFNGGELMGHMESRTPRSHARLLLPMVQQVMLNLQLELAQLDAVAVSKGPGSYTGLRVGVSTAKGLVMAQNLKLMAYDSLLALAMQVRSIAQQMDAWIVPMLDARRMEVYTAVYDAHMNAIFPIQAKIMDRESFSDILAERKVIFLGDGVKKCIPLLETHKHAILLPDILSSAVAMGPYLLQRFQAGNFEELGPFEPFYLKDFVATKPKKLF